MKTESSRPQQSRRLGEVGLLKTRLKRILIAFGHGDRASKKAGNETNKLSVTKVAVSFRCDGRKKC